MISVGAVTTRASPKFQTIIYLPKGSLLRGEVVPRSSYPLGVHVQEFPLLYATNFRPAMRKNQYLWHGVNYPHYTLLGGLFR